MVGKVLRRVLHDEELKKRVDGRQPWPGARYVNRGSAVRQDWTWKYELALNNVGAGG